MSYYSYENRGGFMSNVPVAVKNIIIINVLVMIMTALNENFMYEKFALFYPTSPFFHWWQPLTHMFMHGGFWHLFFNMYTLYIFGSLLENIWGSKKFFLYYMVTGLGAAFLHELVMFFQAESYSAAVAAGDMYAGMKLKMLMMTPTVGASGAVYGILLAFGMMFPNSTLYIYFAIPIKAKWFVLIYGVIELFSGFTSVDNVAHFAHLGGMLFGLILILYWKKKGNLY